MAQVAGVVLAKRRELLGQLGAAAELDQPSY
jgi:hypothetical protein